MSKAKSVKSGAVEVRYWDSTAFLAWLLPEPARVSDLRGVLDAAEHGKALIVTSVLTLTEVIKLKGHPSLPREQQHAINEFFKRSYIVTRGLDRWTASDARELIWKHGLQPKDSIHVATAIRANIRVLETHDDELLKLTGRLPIPGGAPLTIRLPHFSETFPLQFPIERAGKQKKRNGDGY